jgi:hypothetical protein
VARRSSLGLLVEDVHWADGATLDFLTYLVRVGRGDAVTVVVTCRSDDVPLDAGVADWLTHVRRGATVVEIRLGPLSPGEVAEQVAGFRLLLVQSDVNHLSGVRTAKSTTTGTCRGSDRRGRWW